MKHNKLLKRDSPNRRMLRILRAGSVCCVLRASLRPLARRWRKHHSLRSWLRHYGALLNLNVM